jgi:DNA ligase-1
VGNVLQIIEEIANTPGKNDKIELIGQNLDNAEFMLVVDAVLDPLRSYNIKKVPPITENLGEITLTEFIGNLIRFETREVSGKAATEELRRLLTSLSADDAEIGTRVIRRKLNAGFSASSVNKAQPGTILEYPCLKAVGLSENALAKIQYPAPAQLKADGMRANIITREGDVTLRGRSGKEIHLHGNFDFVGNYIANGMQDGEFVLVEDDGSIMPREKGNGILNKAIAGTISKEEAARVRFVGWDSITLEEFDRLEKKAPAGAEGYIRRWGRFTHLVNTICSPKFTAIENRIVNSYEEAVAYFKEAVNRGQEGIILKNMDHPYENRRSEHLVKFKVILDCDMEIIGWNYGKDGGKWGGRIGSLIVASVDRGVETGLAGIAHPILEAINDDFESFKGKIVAVKYNGRIQHKTRPDIDSLFSARFMEVREDKSVADHSDDILWFPAELLTKAA